MNPHKKPTLEAVMQLVDAYVEREADIFSAGATHERSILVAAIRELVGPDAGYQEAHDLAVHRGYADVIEAISAAAIKPKPLDAEVDGVPATEAIPAITEPMGRSWTQPRREDIRITSEFAIMSDSSFKQLAEYSSSYPSGVYEGKMWRRFGGNDLWWLAWYGPSDEPNSCSINRRTIRIHPRVEA